MTSTEVEDATWESPVSGTYPTLVDVTSETPSVLTARVGKDSVTETVVLVADSSFSTLRGKLTGRVVGPASVEAENESSVVENGERSVGMIWVDVTSS